MPNLSNAKKALRQSSARGLKNNVLREEIGSMRRQFRKLVEEKNIKGAEEMMPTLQRKLDKLVTKNIFKKNKVSRIKSRLVKMIQRAK